MVESEPLNQVERTALIERFFKHERLHKVSGVAHCSNMENRVVVLDVAYNKGGGLRLSVFLKGKLLDQAFRSVENVFDGWDCFYWMEIPKESDVERVHSIEQGISELFKCISELILSGEKYWFIIKDIEHFYEFY